MNKHFYSSLATVVAFLLMFTSPANMLGQTWEKKVPSSLLEQTRNGESAAFIILMTQQADVSAAKQLHSKETKGEYVYQTLKATAQVSQKNIIQFLQNNHTSFQPLYIVNAIRAEGNASLIKSVASRNDVQKIMADPKVGFAKPVETGAKEDDGRAAIEWGIDMINANDVWDLGYTGQNVIVGGEDTGYEWDHPALIKKYRGYNEIADTVDHNYNWHDAIHAPDPHHADSVNPCGYDSKEPCDDFGHGTHTMGTMIGGEGENQIGVAPDAQWCACRNMERGYGTPFTYIECFEWFLAPTDLNNENPDPSKAPHVINNSWGCPEEEGCDSSNFEIMEMVVNNLRAAGIVVVVSAGNEGSGCSSISSPAAIYEGSFSVGATRLNDTIAGYSSRGPVLVDHSNRRKPNVSAPGSGVRSSVPGGEYDFSSGTSMAGPHVAGLVALMISANPDIAGEVDLIEDIIESTAVPKTTDQQCGDIPGSEVPNNTYGYGRIDALAAVEAALALVETGINDEHTADLLIYPNPFNEKLMINLPGQQTEGTFTIFDVQGHIMLVEPLGDSNDVLQEVKVDHLPAGFYLYKWNAGSKSRYGKLMKVE